MMLSSSPVSGRSFIFSNRLNPSKMALRSHPNPIAPCDVFFSGKKRKRDENEADSAGDVFMPTQTSNSLLEEALEPLPLEQHIEDFLQTMEQTPNFQPSPQLAAFTSDQPNAAFLQELLTMLETQTRNQSESQTPDQAFLNEMLETQNGQDRLGLEPVLLSSPSPTPPPQETPPILPSSYFELLLYSMIPFPFLAAESPMPTTSHPLLNMPAESATNKPQSQSAREELGQLSYMPKPVTQKQSTRKPQHHYNTRSTNQEPALTRK